MGKESCDLSTEKMIAGALSETDAGVPFIANLPHTRKHNRDEALKQKTDRKLDNGKIFWDFN